MKRRLSLLLIFALLLCGCTQQTVTMYTVKFYDAETARLITEVQMEAGSLLQVPAVAIPNGSVVDGLYMTSTLAGKYDEGAKVTGNLTVFITWKPLTGPTEEPTQGREDPTQAPTVAPTVAPTAEPEDPVYHVVVNGETADAPMVFSESNQLWYQELPALPKGSEVSVFDMAGGKTVASVKSGSAGNYIVTLGFADSQPKLKTEKLAYYAVGSCGNKGGEADVTASNYKYQLVQEGNALVLRITFEEKDTAEDGLVHFRIAYGGDGIALKWFDNAGSDFTLPVGEHTITFDPDTGTILYG